MRNDANVGNLKGLRPFGKIGMACESSWSSSTSGTDSSSLRLVLVAIYSSCEVVAVLGAWGAGAVGAFFTVVGVAAVNMIASRAAWWDFNPSLEVFAASVTFADAFHCHLSCSGTHADIDEVNVPALRCEKPLYSINLFFFQLYSTIYLKFTAASHGFQARA